MQSYVYWALLGMVGYSLTTLFTKLAERSGEVSSYMVLAVSSIIVAICAIAIVGFRGELRPLIFDLEKGRARPGYRRNGSESCLPINTVARSVEKGSSAPRPSPSMRQ